MKPVAKYLIALSLLFVSTTDLAQAQDRTVTLQDVSPELASLIGGSDLDFVQEAEIQYGVTGDDRYDEFFRRSAIAYGGFVFGQGLVDDATVNLKGYARDKAAIAELEAQIQEITGGAPPEEWTTEQSLAVLRTAEAQDQLSDEERAYMVATAAHVAACIPVVEEGVSSSRELVEQAPGLVSGARSAFGMRRAVGIGRNVQRSAERISEIPTKGVALVESLVVLQSGLSMVSGG